ADSGDRGDRLDGELVVVARGDGLVVDGAVQRQLGGRRAVGPELAEQQLPASLGAGGGAERGALCGRGPAVIRALLEEGEHAHHDEHVQEGAAAWSGGGHGQKMKLAVEVMFRRVTSTCVEKSRWPGTLRVPGRFSGLFRTSPAHPPPRLWSTLSDCSRSET